MGRRNLGSPAELRRQPAAGALRAVLLALGSSAALACAASLAPVEGLFGDTSQLGNSAATVTIDFSVRHLQQSRGMDAVPKHRAPVVPDFEELFRDAAEELESLASYSLTTESGPEGQGEVTIRRDFRTKHDFSVDLTFLQESSFAGHALGMLVSGVTLTLAPVPFSWDYTATAELRDPRGDLLHSYRRRGRVTNWVQVALIGAYPFHPIEGKREQLYSDILHDLFREMSRDVRVAPAAG